MRATAATSTRGVQDKAHGPLRRGSKPLDRGDEFGYTPYSQGMDMLNAVFCDLQNI